MTERTSIPESDLALEIDWGRLRTTLHRYFASKLEGSERTHCDDLTQEALVRLLRALRKEPARSLDALAHEIGRRTWTDHVRRARRWRLLLSPVPDGDLDSAPAPPKRAELAGDPLGRVEFIVTEFFHTRQSPCYELALAFFRSLDWEEVARRSNLNAATIRQRWSRCMKSLREFARKSPDLLLAWAHMTDAGS